MDDFDNLNSKTDSDLRQIAVAFGDFTPEEAESKTREELIMAITGAKDIGDVTVVDLAEDPVPVKPAPIPEAMTSIENSKSLDELIVDVGRNARFETNELADAILRAEREEEKKVAKKETVAEDKPSEITEAVADDKKVTKKTEKKADKKAEKADKAEKEAKKPARTTKKTKAKADEAVEDKKEEPAAAAEAVSAESGETVKKPAGRGRKAKAGKKQEEASASGEAKPAEPTPVEALIAEAGSAPAETRASRGSILVKALASDSLAKTMST